MVAARKFKLPVLLINFKAFKEASGSNAVKLALLAEKAARKTGKSVVVAVQASDLRLVSGKVKIPVIAQHVDPASFGSNTGSIIPEAVKDAGGVGSLINHSEKQLPASIIGETVNRCRDSGLISVVCANTPQKAAKLALFNPGFLAVEPPELIGGDISVSKADPEIITKTVNRVLSVARTPVLCGAGIHSESDVREALRLGSRGVLVASGIVKAKNPYKKMLELLSGFD